MLKQLVLERRIYMRIEYFNYIFFYSSKAKALCIVLIQAYFAFLCIIGVKRISS